MKQKAVSRGECSTRVAATPSLLVALSLAVTWSGCFEPTKFGNDGGAGKGSGGIGGHGGPGGTAGGSAGGRTGTAGAPMSSTGGNAGTPGEPSGRGGSGGSGGASAGTGGGGGLGGAGGAAPGGGGAGGGTSTGGADSGGRGGAGGRSGGGAGAGGTSTGGASPDGGASDAAVDMPPPPPTCPAGFADCNGNAADGCEQRIDTDMRCGACNVSCTGLTPFCSTTGAPRCVNPAAALDQQRLETPCTSIPNAQTPDLCTWRPLGTDCPTAGLFLNRMVAFGGRAGAPYDVSIRVRGVVEPKAYTGGRDGGDHFYVGGQPTSTGYNVLRLTVSSPPQVFYLNSDQGDGESHRVFTVDYTKTIRINGGAGLTLEVGDTDCAVVRNCQSFATSACTPLVVAGIPPAPMGFNGQFLQFDVVGIANGAAGSAPP